MGNENLMNEKRLLHELCEGNEKAFETIYVHYHPILLQFALSVLKSHVMAEDVCSEVFENIWKTRSSLTGLTSLKAYLLSSVKNRSFNYLKSISRSKAAKAEIEKLFEQKSFATEKYLLDKEYADFIEEHISKLPSRARQVYQLCREEGYTYEQTASLLQISRNAVKHHMMYCIKKLKASAEKAFGAFLLFLFFLCALFF